MFEPTDLEWEEPGRAEFDLQFGLIRGPSSYRLVVPDAEFDLGITRQIEFDIDGAFALEGPDNATLRLDHIAQDNLWLSLKVGLVSFGIGPQSLVATGLQIGPKLPTARGARQLGVESLWVVGLSSAHHHVVLNFGALLDPVASGTGRPKAFEGGIDLTDELDSTGTWAWVAELGAVRFISADPHQLHLTSGLVWSPNRALSVSVIALAGLAKGSDPYGGLIGVSPSTSLWGN
jgi:hypothetical protein